MKRLLIHSLLVLGCTLHLSAQCPEHQIVLYTQQEVDSFRTKYPGCDSLTVPLTIEGSLITSLQPLLGITYVSQLNILNATNLQSLSGLDSLRHVFMFTIQSTGLHNMQGLGALDTVGWFFRIAVNPQLQNLVGLHSLRSVSDFSLHYNPQLISLQGLDSLSDVNGLTIDYNDVFQHLAGMPALSEIGRLSVAFNNSLTSLFGLEDIILIRHDLHIQGNPALTSIQALYQIIELEDVIIRENTALPSLAGLGSLTRVTGDMVISHNDALLNLEGIGALQRVTGDLLITENPGLVNLSGIFSLRTIGKLSVSHNDALAGLEGMEAINAIGSLSITFNDVLSGCSVESICEHLSSGGEATIGANFDGCRSTAQVLAGCEVATDENSQTRMLVYPNPTHDLVNVSGTEGETFRVEVWNAVGMRFLDMELKHGQLDMSGLQTGLYLVRIALPTGMEQFPIIRH